MCVWGWDGDGEEEGEGERELENIHSRQHTTTGREGRTDRKASDVVLLEMS